MLRVNKSITVTGNSIIQKKEGGALVDHPAVYFHATISTEDGRVNINTSVQETTLYEANKEQCRADENEFRTLVYQTEDELKKG